VVCTVFLTAGDAGLGTVYWQDREMGMQAAYAQMAGVRNVWIPREQLVGDKRIRTYTLAEAPNVSLVFLRFPDGNPNTGGGYEVTGNQSLELLWEGEIPTLASLDGTNAYTKEELIQTLVALMMKSGTQHIHTQDSSNLYGSDHPDHRYGARYAFEAMQRYAASGAHHTFTFYRDYNISNEPVNLTQAQRDAKWDIFTTYALHDASLCGGTGVSCLLGGSYDSWGYRQYSIAQAQGLSGALSVAAGGCLTAVLDASGGTYPAFINSCDGASNQIWSIHADGTVTAPDDRCLEVQGGVTQDGTPIQLAACTGAPEQRWSAFENGQIRGLGGMCLSVPGSPPIDGTSVELDDCAAVPGQQWVLPPVSPQLQENPDFSLAPAPNSSLDVTFRAGESPTYRFVLASRRFAGSVALSCTGLPLGVDCTFSPSSITLDGQNSVNVLLTVTTMDHAHQSLRLFLPGPALMENHAITITASSGNLTRSLTVTLMVD
jgi:LmbE family N-acetylglucosaminyl deacetylase